MAWRIVLVACAAVALLPLELRAQASIIPVSRILRAQASVPPNVHTPPNLIADPDPGGSLSHSASANAGGQSASASITTNIVADLMWFSVVLNAQGGAVQSSANASSTAQINLMDDSVFQFQSQWDISAIGSIAVRDSANIVVFSHGTSPSQATLNLPAGAYTVSFSASLPSPGGVLGGYTFTQIPEPSIGLCALTIPLLAARGRRAR